MAETAFLRHSSMMNHKSAFRENNQGAANLTGLPAAEEFNQNEVYFTPSWDEVARRAYFSYVNQGTPSGCDVQHWLAAEAELIAELSLTRVHGFHN